MSLSRPKKGNLDMWLMVLSTAALTDRAPDGDRSFKYESIVSRSMMARSV